MNSSEMHVFENIKHWIWSGFYNVEEIYEMVDDMLEDDCDEELLKKFASDEFRKKKEDEFSWPKITDCDQLTLAFNELNKIGIIALENTGQTISDGHDDIAAVLHSLDRAKLPIKGYCFYHGQDLERAIDGMGLFLAFGDLNAIDGQKIAVGKEIVGVLTQHNFEIEWNESAEQRIHIAKIIWQKKLRGGDEQ